MVLVGGWLGWCCFLLCFSHSSHLWNDVNEGKDEAEGDKNDDGRRRLATRSEASEDLLFSAFSKTQKDLLCCHEQG